MDRSVGSIASLNFPFESASPTSMVGNLKWNNGDHFQILKWQLLKVLQNVFEIKSILWNLQFCQGVYSPKLICCFSIYFLQINPVLQDYLLLFLLKDIKHIIYSISGLINNLEIGSVCSNHYDIGFFYFIGGSVTHIKELKPKEKYSDLNSEDQRYMQEYMDAVVHILQIMRFKVKISILN